MYCIEWNTGAGNEWIDGILEKAMQVADDNAAYTQQAIEIFDEDMELVARRAWCSTTEFIEENENPIRFGTFGYYADWSFNF